MPDDALRARLLFDFAPYLDAPRGFIRTGVGHDGTIVAVHGLTTEQLYDESSGGARFAKGQLDTPTTYRVVVVRDGEPTVFTIAAERVVATHVQPTDDGVLLVAARCLFPERGSPERNGVHFDLSGRVLCRATFGDGISDVRITPDGRVWAAYFDEGIFGNYGWDGFAPGERRSIGCYGVAAFDLGGLILWQPDGDGMWFDDSSSITPCANDDVWITTYGNSGYELLRISRDGAMTWPRERGAPIALRDNRALLAHGSTATIHRVGPAGTMDPLATRRLLMPTGAPLEPSRADASDHRLYLVHDRCMYVVDEW